MQRSRLVPFTNTVKIPAQQRIRSWHKNCFFSTEEFILDTAHCIIPARESSSTIHTLKKGEPVLYFRTLGILGIDIYGQECNIEDFIKRRRIQDLIILLIQHRKEGLVKEKIFNLFWENYSARSKKDNLNTLIYRLKKLLGVDREIFIIDRVSLKLNPELVAFDLDIFLKEREAVEYLENEGRREEAVSHALKTLTLYRGNFLDTISTDLSLENERSYLKHTYQSLLFRTLRLAVYAGFYLEALTVGKKLLVSDPYCEPAYRLIMAALFYLGNTSEITRLYRDLSEKLQKNYNIDPDEKTYHLKSRLALGVAPSQEEILQEASIFF